MNRIPIAVVGVGAFGKNHARVLANLDQADLVAVVDRDESRARAAAEEFGCKALSDPRELIGMVKAACVAVPTVEHAATGTVLLEAGIDVLIEKPIAADLADADALIAAADRHDRILQIGHLERFNPIVEAAMKSATLPLFFEVHRLGSFSPRSLDVDVVLDLMIHDLDIVLAMVDSPLVRLEATGIPILSTKADISSVRLVFENGCVANFTASRISMEKIRKLRYFQPRQYVSIDYTRQDGAVVGLGENNQIQFQKLTAEKGEPLALQLEGFLRSVQTREPPRVAGRDARKALELALRIVEEMERHSRIVTATLEGRES